MILHGSILYAESKSSLYSCEDGYLVEENGKVEGVYASVLPERFRGMEITDCGRGVIIPAFSDLHVHAAQYVERGLGMDKLLNDWLNQYTFPQESRFADPDYTKLVYDAFLKELIRRGTFHACMFTTIHRESASYLTERMEALGLYGLVGKVNMDMQSPEYLCETAEESLRETERFLEAYSNNKTAKPILTPRFAPTCSDDLLQGLGALGKKYGIGVQTHLVESKWEAAEALRVHPGSTSDTEIYERAGLLDNGPVIGAHFIFPTNEDEALMRKYHGYAVHCPDATANIIAGITPTARLQESGISVALGSDVAGGHNLSVYSQIARAVQFSKLKTFYEPEKNHAIDFTNAFYMATKGGGSVFGKVGSFEKGYACNALVIDGMEDEGFPLTPAERVERFCYIGEASNIKARYLAGKLLTV